MSSTVQAIRSLVTQDGTVQVSVAADDMPTPGPDDVIVAVEASPINPSDLGLLLGGADRDSLRTGAIDGTTALLGELPAAALRANGARLGQSLVVGNEGAGTVIAAGSSDAAQALLGKTVAGIGGGMYATHRQLPAAMCLALPAGVTAEQGASWFVNPLTALGMVETMKMEGHSALVHTAAASNLGQMLQRLCTADDVKLVNIVRRQEQVDLLESQGAQWVCNSSAETFRDDLTQALTETGATIAFDAIGGGEQVDTVLSCMEAAASAGDNFSRYGSDTYKQVYIYGGLDRGATTLRRSYGMTWGVGGWLLTPFLGKIGGEGMERMRQRVASEITTTFASKYTARISLEEVLDPKIASAYAAQATGEKYLITPGA